MEDLFIAVCYLDLPIQLLEIWFIAASCLLRVEQVRDKVHLTFLH